MKAMSDLCPCCSNKLFDRCCGRFLEQGHNAKTAEQLMRSRYTAYALGDHGDYLLNTWLNSESLGLTAGQLSSSEHEWTRLEVLAKSQHGDEAMVEFKAYHRDDSGTELVLHERSRFQRINGCWYYQSGEIF
jgi:SEC-C motif-containing protein